MKFNIQTKLIISYILIILVAILIVGFVVNYSVGQHFRYFYGGGFECNQMTDMGGKACRSGNSFLSAVKQSLIWAGLVATVVAIILSFFFSRMIVVPIRKAIEVTKKIADGDYSKRVKIKSNDEIGELGAALNKMAEGLEKIETLRRELVSNVAHELATPLTNISGYLEALHDEVIKGKEPTKKTLLLLKEEADRLTAMIEDLRELSTVESSNFQLSLAHVSLKELADKIILKLKPQFEAKGVELKLTISSVLPEVLTDENRLTQILINLIDNALCFTPRGGQVEISAQAKNNFIELAVSDTGIGIAKEDLPHIFERFYRADKSRSRKTGGTGIGLAIVKELVRIHGGEIRVESKEGKGTKFSFTLPIVKNNLKIKKKQELET